MGFYITFSVSQTSLQVSFMQKFCWKHSVIILCIQTDVLEYILSWQNVWLYVFWRCQMNQNVVSQILCGSYPIGLISLTLKIVFFASSKTPRTEPSWSKPKTERKKTNRWEHFTTLSLLNFNFRFFSSVRFRFGFRLGSVRFADLRTVDNSSSQYLVKEA